MIDESNEDNLTKIVMDSEDEVIRKKNQCEANKNERLEKLYTMPDLIARSAGSLMLFCPESLTLLLSHSMSATIFCSRSPIF